MHGASDTQSHTIYLQATQQESTSLPFHGRSRPVRLQQPVLWTVPRRWARCRSCVLPAALRDVQQFLHQLQFLCERGDFVPPSSYLYFQHLRLDLHQFAYFHYSCFGQRVHDGDELRLEGEDRRHGAKLSALYAQVHADEWLLSRAPHVHRKMKLQRITQQEPNMPSTHTHECLFKTQASELGAVWPPSGWAGASHSHVKLQYWAVISTHLPLYATLSVCVVLKLPKFGNMFR